MAAAGPPPQGGAENEFDNFREAGEPPDGGGNASDGEQGGEIVMLDGAAAGDLDGITRLSYDGGDLPLSDDDIAHAEVTSRDIDRGDAPHFLLKEITESPNSFAKTLRGKITG